MKILHLMNRSSFIIAADIYLLELSISLHVTNSHYVQALSDSIHVFFPKHFSFFCSTFFISASLFLCVFEIWACFLIFYLSIFLLAEFVLFIGGGPSMISLYILYTIFIPVVFTCTGIS